MAKKKKRDESEAEVVDKSKAEIELELTTGSYSHEKKKKKKKRTAEDESGEQKKTEFVNGDSHEEDKEQSNKKPTVSIALAGSIIDNAQSLELATRLAGQIARAATIFRIDEVVIFDNKSDTANGSNTFTMMEDSDEEETGAAFLIRILKYLETPQYLRKALFRKHNSLRVVGLLPPLDAPHHLRKHEWGPYREGITLNQAPNATGTLVDVGLSKNVVVDQLLEPGIRVTVAMGTNRNLDDQPRKVVSSSKPREEMGSYWGYKVRYAANISTVFKTCPHMGGYDYVIGTSEHGKFVKSSELTIPSFRHLLIAFGGLAGLEESVEEDNSLKGKKAPEIFNCYLNVCPNQGSRTIRTEEAVLISLQYFQEPIDRSLQRFRTSHVGSIEEVILDRAKQKMGIDAKVIQAGLFNTTSTAQDRRTMLEDRIQPKVVQRNV